MRSFDHLHYYFQSKYDVIFEFSAPVFTWTWLCYVRVFATASQIRLSPVTSNIQQFLNHINFIKLRYYMFISFRIASTPCSQLTFTRIYESNPNPWNKMIGIDYNRKSPNTTVCRNMSHMSAGHSNEHNVHLQTTSEGMSKWVSDLNCSRLWLCIKTPINNKKVA